MAIMEITVVPMGIKGTSLSAYVAGCLDVLKREKVKYELTAMGTNIEGNLKDLIRIALKMHAVPFKKGAPRVTTTSPQPEAGWDVLRVKPSTPNICRT